MGKSSKKRGQSAMKQGNQGKRAKAKADDAKRAKANESKRKATQLVDLATRLIDSDDDDDDAPILGSDSTPIMPKPTSVEYAILPTTTHVTVVRQVTEYVKIDYYRRHKFIQTDKQLNVACEHIWNKFRQKNGWMDAPYYLDLACFTGLYGATIKIVLSEARQYGQTKGKNAAQGKYFCCLLRLTGCLLCLTGRVHPKPAHSHLAPASTI
jgi:hypothetical protein